MFEFFQNGRVVLMILRFPCQFCELGNVVVNITSFHFEFVEFSGGFVVGIRIVPVLDEILLEFFPYIDVRRGWYQSSHDPVFDTMLPFGYGCPLYEGEGMHDLSIGVIHDQGIGVEKLV